jgi:hypothetical protein
MKPAVRILAVVVLLAVLLPLVAAACPLCKEAASNTEKTGQAGMWRGMYWSILLMVAMPFSMVGAMIVAVRRARRRQQAGMPAPSPTLPFPDARGARS